MSAALLMHCCCEQVRLRCHPCDDLQLTYQGSDLLTVIVRVLHVESGAAASAK